MRIGELAQNCATELNEFKNHIQNACLSCLELFRLAFLHETNEAFEHIYLLYEKQLGRWVELHSWFPQTKENTDYFVNAVWAKFYYATHGTKFRQFDSIPQIMAYLKRCVHSSIAQYVRQIPPTNSTPLDDMEEILEDENKQSLPSSIEEIWERICLLLPNPQDQLLVEYSFYKELKPAEILQVDSSKWDTAERIYKDLWRIRKTLRTDGILKILLGFEHE